MAFHSRYSIGRLLLVGLAFHVCYIGSVFDCYFTSPVVNGMKSHRLEVPESKRLVLIVGDGLRADLLFSLNPFPSVPGSPQVVAPHLRSIVESRGAFGISHTRVPTESRPGHVALIGGMYEDVSAVTKGWKTNPVDFDSVFNQSSHTFSFGSPDILPMFARGAIPGKVKTWSYNEEQEDFTKDATALDIWVLDELRTLLQNATVDPVLDAQLRSDRVIFFLHLLGLDTTGHSYRPHSPEYMRNIQIVDNIVYETEKLLSEFFQDEDSSYIFTADHGMSVVGNHGDGHPDNTRTPLIAWGRGIRGPLPDSSPSSHDSYSEPWDLGHLLRRDVDQADVAALMSSLLGIDWPVNSVGVLPDVDPTRPGYLNPRLGDKTLADAAFVNARVIIEHYKLKHLLKQSHALLYKPFIELEGSTSSVIPPRLAQLAKIEALIHDGKWYDARQESAEVIRLALDGLRYLQTYDRFLIRSIVIFAYTGWAAHVSLSVFRPGDVDSIKASHNMPVVTIAASLSFVVLSIIFAIQKSPWTYYLYIVFPFYFWHQFIQRTTLPLVYWIKSNGQSKINYLKLILLSGLTVVALQAMVAAYTHRSIWSIGLILIAIPWPFFSWPREVLSGNRQLLAAWIVSCLITSVFPLLSVDKTESLSIILLGGVCIVAAGALSISWLSDNKIKNQRTDSYPLYLFESQSMLIIMSMGITASSVRSLQAKLGLGLVNQMLGWAILVVASLLPFAFRIQHQNPYSKILMYFLGFGPCFIILSISVEGLFYLAYSITLVLWIEVEAMLRANSRDISKPKSLGTYRFQADDVRIALFFLFFVQIAFFGTGNVASISSFYLAPVYRLVPIFNPFLMAALLIFKIIAPYVILSVTFATLNSRLSLPPFSLFLVALTLTDGMTLSFFFNVTDTGSWLEIGQSISFFCITSLLLIWSAGICAAGEILMRDTLLLSPSYISKSD